MKRCQCGEVATHSVHCLPKAAWRAVRSWPHPGAMCQACAERWCVEHNAPGQGVLV